MNKAQVVAFLVILGALIPNRASALEIIYAEGSAVSYVAAHVVLAQARRRMWDSARQQCQWKGYQQEPALVPESGMCQAHYQNRVWQGNCFSEFQCM